LSYVCCLVFKLFCWHRGFVDKKLSTSQPHNFELDPQNAFKLINQVESFLSPSAANSSHNVAKMISSRLSDPQLVPERHVSSSESSMKIVQELKPSFFEPIRMDKYHSSSRSKYSAKSFRQYGLDMKHLLVPVEPTPIGPPQTVRVVDEVAVCEIISGCDDILLDTLLPLLRPKKRTTDEADRRNERKRLKRDSKTPGCLSPFMFDVKLSVQQGLSLLKQNQWFGRYDELCHFYKEHGHCLVPHQDHPVLAQWVKRQRHQYKLKTTCRHSTLTDEREAALEQLNFVWDSHEEIWDERFNELRSFKEVHGHCNVPTTFPEGPHLSIWVKCQRRQYKLYLTGSKSNINPYRISKLNETGFVWNPRNLKL
jgi:hypothetical protein